MTLGGHLAELRHRIIVSVIAVAVGGLVMYFLYGHALDILKQPYCDVLKSNHQLLNGRCTLFVQDPLDQLTIRLQIAVFGGIGLALPIILWQIWRFITPGLHANEKRYAIPFVIASVILFALGGFVAFETLPLALRFFHTVGGSQISAIYAPKPYLRLVILLIVAYGVAFEFPVVLVALQLAHAVTSAKLRKWRRAAIIGVTVFAAVFTPSSDPVSMFAMAIPMYIFYEASILIGRLLKR